MRKITLGFLMICNLILLAAILIFHVGESVRIGNESRSAIALMEKNGITVQEQVYRTLSDSRRAYTLRTDTAQRDALCEKLLGDDAQAQAQSGGSVMWSGSGGMLTWSTNGSLNGTADLSIYGSFADENDAVAQIKKLMRRSGIDMSDVEVTGVSDMSNIVVKATQSVDSMELLNNELKFTFDSQATATVEGQWSFGKPEKIVMEELERSSQVNVLLAVAKANSAVTEITEAAPVYVLSNKSGGRFTMIPCWKLTTDQGDIVIDPTTGEQAGADNTPPAGTQDGQSAGSAVPTDPYSQTNPTDGTLPADDGTGSSTDAGVTITDDGTTDTGGTGIVGDDSAWDSTTGTDKTDPEVPDENGVYG